jgi:hypothetical protein
MRQTCDIQLLPLHGRLYAMQWNVAWEFSFDRMDWTASKWETESQLPKANIFQQRNSMVGCLSYHIRRMWAHWHFNKGRVMADHRRLNERLPCRLLLDV